MAAVCHLVLLLKRKDITLEFGNVEINTSSSARIVHLPETKAISHLLTYATAFLGCHFRVTQRKSLEIQACSVSKGRTLSS